MSKTNGRVYGTVKWFHKRRGYGFITPEDGGEDAFIHYSNIVSDEHYKLLEPNQRVSYVSVETKEGPLAKELHKEI